MSQRVLIVGVSETGKTSLAWELVNGSGLPCFVRDPFDDLEDADGNPKPWPNCVWLGTDMEEFKKQILAVNYPRIGIVDETTDGALGVGEKQNHCVFTNFRHHAILPIVIGQRMNMIAPNVRTSSTDLYLFETALEDCETLARDKNCPELVEAANFSAGDFFHLRKVNGKNTLTQHRLW